MNPGTYDFWCMRKGIEINMMEPDQSKKYEKLEF